MLRRFSLFVLMVVSLSAFAEPAFAETTAQKIERCGAQNAIIIQAIEMRLARKSEDVAKKTILADESKTAKKYATGVPGMVGLIYSMKRREVKELDASSFEKACLAYEP